MSNNRLKNRKKYYFCPIFKFVILNKHFYITAFFVLVVLAAVLWLAPIYIYGVGLLLYLGLLSWGVFDIRLSYFIPTQYCLKGRPSKTVVLTFDDGPSALTPQFLDLLKQYNAKAVFFCVGEQMQKYPEVVRRMKTEGHLVANHTFSHQPRNLLHTQRLIDEIKRTDAVLAELGIHTPLFRPPYGITNPPLARAIRATQKKTIGWDIRSLDTVITDEDRLFRRITRKLSAGNIILMHDKFERSLHVLERLLQYLKDNNYTITTDF